MALSPALLAPAGEMPVPAPQRLADAQSRAEPEPFPARWRSLQRLAMASRKIVRTLETSGQLGSAVPASAFDAQGRAHLSRSLRRRATGKRTLISLLQQVEPR